MAKPTTSTTVVSKIQASKPSILGKDGTIPSKESINAWKSCLIQYLKSDSEFRDFVIKGKSWKSLNSCPNRGYVKEEESSLADTIDRLLNLVSSYTPDILQHDIINDSTSFSWIWKLIYTFYRCESNEVNFIEWDSLTIKSNERELPDLLYRRLRAFMRDNLLSTSSTVTFNNKTVSEDEKLTPTLERLIVLKWLSMLHVDLPKLVGRKYATELANMSLYDLQPQLSRVMPSLLLELDNPTELVDVNYTSGSNFRNKSRNKPHTYNFDKKKGDFKPTCELCTAANRPNSHKLLSCNYLKKFTRSDIIARSLSVFEFDKESVDEADLNVTRDVEDNELEKL